MRNYENKINNSGERVRRVCVNAMQQGLLGVYTGRESIKIGPTLTISKNAMGEGLNVLNEQIVKEFKK